MMLNAIQVTLSNFFYEYNFITKLPLKLIYRGGVLEDVLGLEDVLEDTFWSPWPWPRRSSPRKLACPRLEGSTIFWIVKILWSTWKILWKTFFCGDCLKNFCEDLFFFFFWDRLKNFCEDLFFFFFFFWRALALVSLILGLGLEHSCPWPRECLSPERLSLASDFFCVLGLGLEPCVLDSTSGSYILFFQWSLVWLYRFRRLRLQIRTHAINFPLRLFHL